MAECIERLKAEGWRVVKTKDWGHWPKFDRWGEHVRSHPTYAHLVEIIEEA
jgi:hypothetical protein